MGLHERVWCYEFLEVRDAGTAESRRRHTSGVANLLRAQTDHGGLEGPIQRQGTSAATGHGPLLLPNSLSNNMRNRINKNNDTQKNRIRNDCSDKKRTKKNDIR